MTQVHMYSSIYIQKYTSKQVHIYTGTHILMYKSTQVCKYPGIMICKVALCLNGQEITWIEKVTAYHILTILKLQSLRSVNTLNNSKLGQKDV